MARRTKKLIVGYTAGVFDLFHIGHLNLLKNAKSECDLLIVAVTTDELCQRIKGRRPVIPFTERFAIIKSIRYCDKAIKLVQINEIRDHSVLQFDVIFKGSDWQNTEKWNNLISYFSSNNVAVKFFPYTKTTSSTVLKELIMRSIDGIASHEK